MLVLKQLLIGVVLPAVLAAVSRLLGWRPWQADTGAKRPQWGGPVSFAVAYLGAHLAIVGAPELAPTDDMQWLVHLAVIAAVVGVVDVLFEQKAWLRWLLRAGLLLVTFWLVLGFMIEHQWDATSAALWLAGLTIATLAIMGTLDMFIDEYPGASAPLVMVLLGTAGALVLALGGTAKVGQLLGGLTAAAGVAMVFSWLRSGKTLTHGGVTVFVLLFAGLFSYGYMSIAEIPAMSELLDSYLTLAALLVTVSVFLLWAARLDFFDKLAAWQRVLAFALIVSAPLAAAVYMAANPPEEPVEENKLEGVDYDALYQ